MCRVEKKCRFDSYDGVQLWSMYGVRKYRFSSGSIPEDSSVKNIEIISMNQSLMVSGAYGNSGNLI